MVEELPAVIEEMSAEEVEKFRGPAARVGAGKQTAGWL